MNPFVVVQPKSHAQAAAALAQGGSYKLPVLKAGGIDLLDHLKEGLMAPDAVVNLRGVAMSGPAVSRTTDGRIRIEAGATLAQIAADSIVLEAAPALAQAAASAATPAIRNVATAAGNLLQRPRCWYYRHAQFPCLKKGGSTCFAVEGENAHHAIFGPGPCHIVHPSNLAPALAILDGTVHLVGSKRSSLSMSDLYHMPDKGILSEHELQPGEVITHLTFRPEAMSGFHAVKAKQSFDWPCAFACASVRVEAGTIREAKVCAGAVAPVPWMLPRVADALRGVKVDDDAAIAKAASLAAQGATPMRDNGHKVALLVASVRRATLRALGREHPAFREIRA